MPDSHNTSEPAPQFTAGECKERNPHGGLVCRRPRRHAGGHVDTNGLYWQRTDLDAALVPPAPYRMPVDGAS